MSISRSPTDTSQHGWSARVVVRYGLLQLPGLALLGLFLVLARRWFGIPSWLVWGFLALWVLKDVILFPLVWRAYDRDQPRDKNPLIGAHGSARDRLAPSGYILVHGELWQAEVREGSPPIEKGKGVLVRGTRGLTLIVEPANEETG